MKNVLLTFLSDIKTGTDGTVSESYYETTAGEKIHATNESAVLYILKSGVKLDRIFIFASERIRGDIIDRNGKKYLAEDGKPRTHLDYFKERLSSEFQLNADKCIVYPYDEGKSSNAYNLKSVAEMAELIQNFAKNCGDEVTLHVDLTGGMRHVNMMMLDVTRLLEYSGIKEIGRLIYTSYDFKTRICHVEEVRDIYDLFQLIAGVEEFVQFGSVKALDEYYKAKSLSPALKKLVDAMRTFAEEIKLCHYGRLEESIENLHDAVHDFKAGDDVQDILMERLIERIRADYKPIIINRLRDDLSIIRWCVDHDYLQQALTLYVERIPEYLGEKGFIEQSDEKSKELDRLVARDEMHRGRWFYLLNEYKSRIDRSSIDNGLNHFCGELKKAVSSKNFSYDEWLANLSAKLKPLNVSCADEPRLRSQLELIAGLRKTPAPLFELSSPTLEPIRAIIDKFMPELQDLDKAHRRAKSIIKVISKMPNEEIKDYFPELKFARDITEKYPNAVRIYALIEDKVFKPRIALEDFLSIMDRYVRLKIERNDSNHAHSELRGEFETADKLKECIGAGLREIEAAKKYLSKGAENE